MIDELARALADSLGLDPGPIGIMYSEEPAPGSFRPKYACVGIKHAFRGKTVTLSRENLVCPGGIHWLGFMDLEEILVAFLVMFEQSFSDSDVARRWFRSCPVPRFGRAEYVVLGPLDVFEEKPDLVAAMCTPVQAEALQSLLTFSRGDHVTSQRFCATCQGVITNALAQPSLTIPDEFSRKVARFPEDLMIFSMPYEFAVEAARNVEVWKVDMDDIFRRVVEITRGGGGAAGARDGEP
ncbi:MAG: DUF169 domain-containing protein [Actinomycetota bacterium]